MFQIISNRFSLDLTVSHVKVPEGEILRNIKHLNAYYLPLWKENKLTWKRNYFFFLYMYKYNTINYISIQEWIDIVHIIVQLKMFTRHTFITLWSWHTWTEQNIILCGFYYRAQLTLWITESTDNLVLFFFRLEKCENVIVVWMRVLINGIEQKGLYVPHFHIVVIL